MLAIEEILKYYSNKEKLQPRAALKEYLQYRILDIIFSSKYGNRLIFMGGTCIRIVYGNDRFSEDIDIDNYRLSEKEFEDLMFIVKNDLQKEGLTVELRNTFKDVYHCYLKFPAILFNNQLSPLKDEKIVIQIDSFHLKKKPIFETFVLSKFDVFTEIKTYSAKTLLAQKIFTLINRKRFKGRDIYDIVYLYSLTSPDWQYLKKYTGIRNEKELKQKLYNFFTKAQLKNLARDVEPFLIHPKKIKQIELFNEWLKNI